MRLINWVAVVIACSVLVGCGGHGFEDEYSVYANVRVPMSLAVITEIPADKRQEFFNDFVSSYPAPAQMEIGSDYVEVGGKREEFDDISVNEINGERFLVFTQDNATKKFNILNDDTLVVPHPRNDLKGSILRRID